MNGKRKTKWEVTCKKDKIEQRGKSKDYKLIMNASKNSINITEKNIKL